MHKQTVDRYHHMTCDICGKTETIKEEVMNGGPLDMNEKIIKDIEEMLMENRTLRSTSTNNLYNDNSRHNNDVLARAKRVIIKATDNYEKGLNDAWHLARLIVDGDNPDHLSCKDIRDIYGCTWHKVFEDYTAWDAIKSYNDWLKEQEAAKPKLGDVVEVSYCDRIGTKMYARGVFIKESDTTYNIIVLEGDVYVFDKDHIESIEKTGDHVDILGALGKENCNERKNY